MKHPNFQITSIGKNTFNCRLKQYHARYHIFNFFKYIYFAYIFNNFHFPTQLVGGFTLSGLRDKPWSQVSSLLPPGYLP